MSEIKERLDALFEALKALDSPLFSNPPTEIDEWRETLSAARDLPHHLFEAAQQMQMALINALLIVGREDLHPEVHDTTKMLLAYAELVEFLEACNQRVGELPDITTQTP